MILCPECEGESQVAETRRADKTAHRRRVCTGCGHRWTTIEVLRPPLPKPVRTMPPGVREKGLQVRREQRDALIARRHGFPVELAPDYWRLTKNGHMSAKEAASVLKASAGRVLSVMPIARNGQ